MLPQIMNDQIILVPRYDVFKTHLKFSILLWVFSGIANLASDYGWSNLFMVRDIKLL